MKNEAPQLKLPNPGAMESVVEAFAPLPEAEEPKVVFEELADISREEWDRIAAAPRRSSPALLFEKQIGDELAKEIGARFGEDRGRAVADAIAQQPGALDIPAALEVALGPTGRRFAAKAGKK